MPKERPGLETESKKSNIYLVELQNYYGLATPFDLYFPFFETESLEPLSYAFPPLSVVSVGKITGLFSFTGPQMEWKCVPGAAPTG